MNSTEPGMSSSNPSLDSTLGALYVGIVIAMSLWGVASLQTFIYFMRFPRDAWHVKALVTIVWILDSIHQGMFTHAGYKYFITDYGSQSYLRRIELSLEYIIIISAILSLLVQAFLVYRVWILSRRNIPLAVALGLIVMAAFCLLSAYFGESIRSRTFSNIHSREWLAKASQSLVVTSDFAIAGALIYYLNRSRTGFKDTESTINRLIVLTIHTGLSTSIVAALTLLFLSLYPHKLIYIAFFGNICKLYTNSLLATLNARPSPFDASFGQAGSANSFVLSGVRDRGHGGVDYHVGGREHVLSIHVTTETTEERNLPADHGKDLGSEERSQISGKDLDFV